MVVQAPTPREVCILTLLCIFLLSLSNSASSPNLPFLALVPNTTTTPLHSHKDILHIPPLDTQLTWHSKPPPQTEILAHTPGWTIFEKLYIYKGVVYVVSDNPNSVPDPSYIYSKGINIKPGKEAEDSRLPTDEDIRVISTSEARQLFGASARTIEGATFLVNDPPQFVTHYYHWSAELWFGFWRTYSSLDRTINKAGNTTLPPIQRIWFNRLDNNHWRDYASLNQWVVRASFPSVTMEFIDDWRDRAEMDRPFVFERVILADRSAAMMSYNYLRFQRTASSPAVLPATLDWWQPIRNNVVQFAGLDPSVGGGTLGRPVITYISRQDWGRRMLIPSHHQKLVEKLNNLRDEYDCEVNIVNAEDMSPVEQIRLAARTTVLMGVHGNGLTSLVWMNPTPRSTVMEFFYPKGFAHDYEWTTRALDMEHFGFWDSQTFTSPGLPLPEYVEGFQGNEIPIDADAVIRLCVERLALSNEIDD
ncbi:hypothetical protein BJ165DRAFT_1345463 [Panaeolus papilionaceus]|nr:hypothetical protein BJ165DRAFT_1345463 [Panaeolus papilionaceus]